jgi:membrane protein
MSLLQRFHLWLKDFSHIPWRSTISVLRERFREDRLGLTASSLTFTTTIALVPVLTVALAVFTAFPMFSTFQAVLQKWLVESLIPPDISRQVLGYLTQFSSKASKLGSFGLVALLATATAMIFTIDRTLNNIWRVRTRRPFGQRLIIYWAAITLGPLLLAASLTMTTYLVTASRGLVGNMPAAFQLFWGVLEFFLLAGGMTALYHYVPYTHVKWGHAWTGGLFVATGIEVAKRVLTLYLGAMPTYSMVYGAFAIVPILLVWIYVAWVVVLLGAVVAAYLPSLLAGVARQASQYGWQFQLAIELLRELHQARPTPPKGLSMLQLVQRLQVDAPQLEPVLEALAQLDWVARIAEVESQEEARYILLADPDNCRLAPLMALLLLPPMDATRGLWNSPKWQAITLREVL